MPDTAPSAIGTLIIIGQPPTDLAAFCFSGKAARTIIVEPDPERAEEAKARLAGKADVRTITAAPWTGKPKPELTTYNFPGLRSLYAPNERLKHLLPGLTARHSIGVESITLEALTAEIGDVHRPAHVVINLPGSEYPIIKFWHETGFLQRIAQFDLLCGAEAFFDEDRPAGDLQALFSANGFDLLYQRNEDPDWPRLTFRANALRRELATLHDDLARRDTDLTETRQQLEEQAQAMAMAQERASRAEIALTETRARLADAEAQIAAQAQDAEAARQESKTVTADLQKALADREGAQRQLEAQSNAAAAAEERAVEAEKALSGLRASLATARAQAENEAQAAAAARSQADELQSEITELREALADRDAALTEARSET